MTQDTLAKAVAATLGFEGRIAWLYRDDAPEGYATAGAGHKCATQADALLLPWQVAGQPATPQQIAADYQAIMAAPLGGAAVNSHRAPPISVSRNNYVRDLFLQAAAA
jgi:hypothetical protein